MNITFTRNYKFKYSGLFMQHKKLEACIMKDVRERYNSSEDFTEDNLASDNRAAKEFPEDNMATAIYEFLYGSDNIDIDTLL